LSDALEETKRFHSHAERYDWIDDPRRLSHVYHRRREAETVRTVKRYWLGEPVLDVGTGTGLIMRSLHGSLCVGLDLNLWAVDKARRHCMQSSFVAADGEELPIRTCSCRMVICTEVLEHSPRPSQILSEILRVLKPGGVLVGSVPSRSPIWRLRPLLSSRHGALEPAHGCYSRTGVMQLLEAFDVLEARSRAYGLVVMFVARKPVTV
jgi:ubiquinone/menaquinone biosynthesis C-methylase UbiE